MRSARKCATAEAEDGVGDGTGDGDVSTLADPSNNAKYERTGSTQTELTTIWCDNNADQRPDADAAVLTHVLCFTLTSEDGGSFKGMLFAGRCWKTWFGRDYACHSALVQQHFCSAYGDQHLYCYRVRTADDVDRCGD